MKLPRRTRLGTCFDSLVSRRQSDGIANAALVGDVHRLVTILQRDGVDPTVTENPKAGFVNEVAARGDAATLRVLLRFKFPIFLSTLRDVIRKGADGHHRCLRLLQRRAPDLIPEQVAHANRMTFMPLSEAAGESGCRECLEFVARHHPDHLSKATLGAARKGHDELLTYAAEGLGIPLHDDTLVTAAAAGSLSCVKYALRWGIPPYPVAVEKAVINGHVEVVLYLRPQSGADDEGLMQVASVCGRVGVIRAMLDRIGLMPSPKLLMLAVQHGHVDVVELLVDRGCELSQVATLCAAENGRVDMLERLLQLRCPWHPDTLHHAHRDVWYEVRRLETQAIDDGLTTRRQQRPYLL